MAKVCFVSIDISSLSDFVNILDLDSRVHYGASVITALSCLRVCEEHIIFLVKVRILLFIINCSLLTMMIFQMSAREDTTALALSRHLLLESLRSTPICVVSPCVPFFLIH
jgi:hypothetical protein